MRRWLSATMRLPICISDDLVAVGQQALDGEDAERADADQDQGAEILVHIGLVDDVAEQIGGERRAGGRDPPSCTKART